jgi:hypothetical protein
MTMGVWAKELDRVLKQSETNKKVIDEDTAYYQKVADASQAFTGAFTKAALEFGKMRSTLLDLAEDCARLAGELSVIEDDELEPAKKGKDKAAVKKIEAKMKPLIASFESTKKEGLKLAEKGNKLDDDLKALIKAITAAIG